MADLDEPARERAAFGSRYCGGRDNLAFQCATDRAQVFARLFKDCLGAFLPIRDCALARSQVATCAHFRLISP